MVFCFSYTENVIILVGGVGDLKYAFFPSSGFTWEKTYNFQISWRKNAWLLSLQVACTAFVRLEQSSFRSVSPAYYCCLVAQTRSLLPPFWFKRKSRDFPCTLGPHQIKSTLFGSIAFYSADNIPKDRNQNRGWRRINYSILISRIFSSPHRCLRPLTKSRFTTENNFRTFQEI